MAFFAGPVEFSMVKLLPPAEHLNPFELSFEKVELQWAGS